MTELEQLHGELVRRLAKPGDEIMASLTPEKCHIIHMAMGMSGEAGEVLDLVKKSIFYDKVISKQDLIKEMGDVEFYLRGLRQAYGISRDEVIQGNLTKLDDRYSSGTYSDQQAISRKDTKD